MELAGLFLDDALFTFRYYKDLAERALAQVADDQLMWRADDEANSLAIVMRHMAGNMASRWTDFLTSDGEKPWRERDQEFESPEGDRAALMAHWEAGWAVLFGALEALEPSDVLRVVQIRGKDHTVMQAIFRQMTHYCYHVGQIVQLARQLVGKHAWRTLSIARGQSKAYVPQGRL